MPNQHRSAFVRKLMPELIFKTDAEPLNHHFEKLQVFMSRRAEQLHKAPGGFVSQMAMVAAEYIRHLSYQIDPQAAQRAAQRIIDTQAGCPVGTTPDFMKKLMRIIMEECAGIAEVTPEMIVYSVAQKDKGFRAHVIEQLMAMNRVEELNVNESCNRIPSSPQRETRRLGRCLR